MIPIQCERIKYLRKDLGMTQVEFSDFLGFSLESVRGWEQGRHVPSTDTMKIVAEKCGVNYNFLNGDASVADSSMNALIPSDLVASLMCFNESQRGYIFDLIKDPKFCELYIQICDGWNGDNISDSVKNAKALLYDLNNRLKLHIGVSAVRAGCQYDEYIHVFRQ